MPILSQRPFQLQLKHTEKHPESLATHTQKVYLTLSRIAVIKPVSCSRLFDHKKIRCNAKLCICCAHYAHPMQCKIVWLRPRLSPSETLRCRNARNAPGSLSLWNALLPMGEQSPRLSPFETFCPQRARNAPGSLPPKQSPANVRATPPASLRPKHFATNVGTRGGGEVGALSRRSSTWATTSTGGQGTGGGTDGRRPENGEIRNKRGRNRGVLKAAIL
jgi:hypothetical protein